MDGYFFYDDLTVRLDTERECATRDSISRWNLNYLIIISVFQIIRRYFSAAVRNFLCDKIPLFIVDFNLDAFHWLGISAVINDSQVKLSFYKGIICLISKCTVFTYRSSTFCTVKHIAFRSGYFFDIVASCSNLFQTRFTVHVGRLHRIGDIIIIYCKYRVL